MATAELKRTFSSEENEQGEVTITKIYLVDKLSGDGVTEIYSATGLPVINQALAGETGYVCNNRRIKSIDETKLLAEVEVTYIRRATTLQQNDTVNSEASRLLSYTFDNIRIEQALFRAYDKGNTDTRGTPTIAILNSAYQPFGDPVTDDKVNIILRFTQREYSQFVPGSAIFFINTINKLPITILDIGIPAKRAYLRNMVPTMQRDAENEIFYNTTYEIEVDPDQKMWQYIQDKGFAQLDEYNKPIDILKETLNPRLATGTDEEKAEGAEKINDPALLDGSGAIVSPPLTPASGVYLSFETKFATDWNEGLNLVESVR